MGSCIICGTATEGEVCDVHEQDVGFVFEGSSPHELTPNRFYRGTVDGYADFGVFVDIGDAVTGLLHQSELDRRLESLEWEPGDEVFVQVDGIRDNGNVDLTWSIRQSGDEFRGLLIDSPEGQRRYDDGDRADEDSDGEGSDGPAATGGEPSGNEHVRQRQSDGGRTARQSSGSAGAGGQTGDGERDSEDERGDPEDASDRGAVTDTEDDTGTPAQSTESATAAAGETAPATAEPADSPEETSATDGAETSAPADAPEEPEPEPATVSVASLEDHVGDLVRFEGEVTGVHQTGGPTIFEVRDGSATAECAAFDGAGVRAYPEVEVGDVVRLDGTVERRRGELQVETETLLVLTGEERESVAAAIDDAIEDAVRPDTAHFAADDDPAEPLADGIVAAATAVRRALAEERPVVIRHPATADGHAAGAAIERGGFARARSEADGAEPDYHAIHRRPLDDPYYGMDAATSDLTRMLQDRERHGEQFPLLVLVGTGTSQEAAEAVELLDVYDVERIVLDTAEPDDDADAVGDPIVTPHDAGIDVELSDAALGAALGATVAPPVREELAHVPAVGYWEEPPAVYAETAKAAGYDPETLQDVREALALEAHYQSYNDKRELVADVLFEGATALAGHVAEQFREKLETEVQTARDNLVVRDTDGVRFAVLDTDAFTHRFDFPPTAILLDALHRSEREEAEGAVVTIGAGEEELYVRSTEPVDVREIAAIASESVPGVDAVGGRDGHLEYLPGDRDDAIEAVVGALAGTIEA